MKNFYIRGSFILIVVLLKMAPRFSRLIIGAAFLAIFGIGFIEADEFDEVDVEAVYFEALDALNGVDGKVDLKNAIRLFRTAANEGDARSQHVLGTLYSSGYGVRKNMRQSFRWHELAAESRYPFAMVDFAYAYLRGDGGDVDREKAKALFEEVANPKSRFEVSPNENSYFLLRKARADSSYTLGLMILEDEKESEKPSSENEARAIALMEKAAASGNADAIMYLAISYAKGEKMEVNLDRSKTLFEQYKLVLSDRVRRGTLGFMEGVDSAFAKDFKESFEEMNEALDSAVDEMLVGFVVEELAKTGDDRHLSDKDAVDLLQTVVGGQDGLANLVLGLLHVRGAEEIRDEVKAYEYINQSARFGGSVSIYNQAVMLLSGIGVEKDVEQGRIQMRKASYVHLYAARAYLDGDLEATFLNQEEALELCVEAKEKNDLRARASYLYRQSIGWGVPRVSKSKKIFREYLELAREGSSTAQYLVGEAFYQGKGVEVDYKKAKQWLEKAVAAGDESAMFRLGYMYSSGTGVEVGEKRAVELYSQIQDVSDAARNNLANFYFSGTIVNKDRKKACEMYLKSADEGDSVAMKNLADCYATGTGLEQSLEMAIDWYSKSADEGSKLSALQLVRIYKKTKVDLEEESYWLEVAAENGDVDSMLEVAKRYKSGTGFIVSAAKCNYWASVYISNNPYSYGRLSTDQFFAYRIIGWSLTEPGWSGTDVEAGAGIYESLGEMGYFYPQLDLGKMHEDGLLKKSNPKKAMSLYKNVFKTCSDGNKRERALSALAIARCFENGIGTSVSRKKQIQWLEHALEASAVEAAYALALIYLKEEKGTALWKRGIVLMGSAARDEYIPAVFWIAEYHLKSGRDNESTQLLVAWLIEKAREGNSKARALLRDYKIPYEAPKERVPSSEEDEEPVIMDMGIASSVSRLRPAA